METFSVVGNEIIKSQSKDNVVDLVLNTIDKGKQVLVFNNSKSSSEATAERISKSIKKISNKETLEKVSKKILNSLSSPTKQCRRLAMVVEKGVAFHHSGLTAKQRSLIENEFKKGNIKVISSTPTLAAGMNLPAYKVIIKDYKRYSQRGFNDIPVLEYHQMSGRAGRPGQEDVGKAVLNVKSQDELSRVVPKYIFGDPEEVVSKLAVEPTLKMYILSLVSMNMINSEEEIKNFFANTLYAEQYKDLEGLYYNIFRVLDVLKDYGFIEQQDSYYMATRLGRKISELYLNPDTAYYFINHIDELFKRFSKENLSRYDVYYLIHFIVDTIEMKPLFRVSKFEEEKYVSKAEEVSDSLISPFDPFEIDYGTFLNEIKTSEVLYDWIMEAPEDYISEKYKVTPGELHYKMETVDWLLYSLEEISTLKKNFYFKNYLSRLRVRFKMGIKEDLLPLVSLKGVGRVRARKLYGGGFKKLSDLRKADFKAISKLVGDSITIKIKEQVSNPTDDLNKGFLEKSLEVPKEIQVRDVSSEEVEQLVENETKFQKEKEEINKSLSDFF